MLSSNVFQLIVPFFVRFIIVYNPYLSIAAVASNNNNNNNNNIITSSSNSSSSSACEIMVYKPDDNSTVGVDMSTILNRCVGQTVCIRKCCPLNYAYSCKSKQCQPRSSNNITISAGLRGQLPGQIPGQLEEENFKKILVFEGTSSDDNTKVISLTYGYNRRNFYLKSDKFSILSNGSILMLRTNQLKDASEYCLDEDSEDGKLTAWICLSKDIKVLRSWSQTVYQLYVVGRSISLISLLCTFLIYCSNEFNNLHGKCLKQYTVSLITSNFLFIILTLRYVDYKDEIYCLVFGVAAQFLLLASFFFLNVMCFDLWRTLRISRNILQESSNKRFLHYFLYAWGCPCYIIIVELLIQFVPGMPSWITKPRLGECTCWLDEEARFYFYIPIGLVLLANTLMFVSTAGVIIGNKKNSKYLNRSSSSGKRNAFEIRRFSICFKLYIVMGLNWIMELLTWYLEDPIYLRYISDTCNILQGLFIFLIFVCKRRVLYMLDEKFCSRRRFFAPKSSIWTTTTSMNSAANRKNKIIRMAVLNNEQQQQLKGGSDVL